MRGRGRRRPATPAATACSRLSLANGRRAGSFASVSRSASRFLTKSSADSKQAWFLRPYFWTSGSAAAYGPDRRRGPITHGAPQAEEACGEEPRAPAAAAAHPNPLPSRGHRNPARRCRRSIRLLDQSWDPCLQVLFHLLWALLSPLLVLMILTASWWFRAAFTAGSRSGTSLQSCQTSWPSEIRTWGKVSGCRVVRQRGPPCGRRRANAVSTWPAAKVRPSFLPRTARGAPSCRLWACGASLSEWWYRVYRCFLLHHT